MYKKSILLFVLATFLSGVFVSPVQAVTRKPAMAARRIDGVADLKSKQNQWPYAVMIDNHGSARPQAGLDKASIVYEALAEGGIPRFMAVFVRTDPTLIGPVRSVRPYFAKIASEYPAALAHVGGSPDGIETVKRLKLPNIEGQRGLTAKYFFKKSGLPSPHNTFTSGAQMLRFMKTRSYYNQSRPTYTAWKYTGDKPLSKRPKKQQGIEINLGAGRNYMVKYQYDRKRNVYLRFTGGRAHIDRVSHQQLFAKNVIIQMVPKEKILDRKLRIDLQVTGKGKAVLFSNGVTQTISWEKKSDRARTIYKDSFGKPITLVEGSTWITYLPKGRSYRVF